MRWAAEIAGAVLLASAFMGCGTAKRERVVFDYLPAYESLRLEVENFRGDVRIEVGEEHEKLEVRIVERARKEGRKVDAQGMGYDGLPATLEKLTVTTTVEDTDDPKVGVVRVVSATEFEAPEIQRCVLRITLPKVDGVRVTNHDGTVDLANVAGSVWVENTKGKVMLRTNAALEDPVTITTTEGEVNFRVTRASTGTIDAEAVDGRVILRGGSGRVNVAQNGENRLKAVLGEGGSPMVLRTTDERIKIVIDDDDAVTVGSLQKW